MRLDLVLKQSGLIKRRTVAKELAERGRILINDRVAKPSSEVKAGDVVNIPPEVKHWHGAAKDSWFVHITVEVPAKNSSTEWLEPVSDAEYNQLP